MADEGTKAKNAERYERAASVDTEQAYGVHRRIIDRCMTSSGHVVLNDLGRG